VHLADISRIKSELEWEPRVSFEQGLDHAEEYRLLAARAGLGSESIEQATKTWFQFLEGKP